MAKLRQFLLLLWKNYVLQKRKVVVTLFEIGLPTFFSLILIFIRQKVIAEPVNHPTTWEPFGAEYLPQSLCPTAPLCPGFGPQTWKVYYSPNNSVIDSIMNRVMTRLGPSNISGIVGFRTEDDMVKELMAKLEDDSKETVVDILGGVVFSTDPNNPYNDSLPVNVSYKIRLPSSPRNGGKNKKFNLFLHDTKWMTEFMFPLVQLVGPREKKKLWGGKPGYMSEGFLPLQHAVGWAILEYFQPDALNDTPIEIQLRRFPYPHYNDDPFVLIIQNQFPMILLLSFIFSALNIVKDLVHEKERKLKESMKMMGLNNWLHWAAWFVKYFLFLLIAVIIMTIFFCIRVGKYGRVIGYTSPTVLLVFLILYSIATISFCFMVSVFFSKANSAAAAGGILFFVTYIPYFFLQNRYDTLSLGLKIGLCLDFNVAMPLATQVIGMFEGTGAGVHWNNIHKGVSVDDKFTLLYVFLMLILDAVIYALVTWYVEAVFPGEFGIPRKWYFPVQKSYWCGTQPTYEDEDEEELSSSFSSEVTASSSSEGDFMEREPHGLRAGIKIKKLRKEFSDGASAKVAVSGMNLNMYEGQITALLGHNGAGKTTTMSMLTGFIPPTSGTAVVNGFNIWTDIAGVRNSLGLCPQHDVLFDSLTVEEHLYFFAKLKGYPGNQVEEEVQKMVNAIGLKYKQDQQAKTLSGGMKRKLSVGIALIGDSKIVILDEPTSGMDPEAGRQAWSLLQQQREGRTILLTTHFMDEADLLGDRIAIMADGIIQCCGSSLFLKNKYGAGYHMVIVKEDGCDVAAITEIVTNFVPSARLESNISAELSYILPQESSREFEMLFTEIESKKVELKIASYGASVTTMEEVFLRVGESADLTLKEKLYSGDANFSGGFTQPLFNTNIKKNSGYVLFCQQMAAMLLKRVLHSGRNWLVTATQLFVPIFFTLMALIVVKTLPGPEDSPPLELNMTKFDHNIIGYSSHGKEHLGKVTERMASAFALQFENEHSNTNLKYLNNMTKYKDNPSVEQFLVDEGNRSMSTYNDHYLIAGEFRKNKETVSTNNDTVLATFYFNDQAYHTPAMTLAAGFNGILKYFTNNSFTIKTTNFPLPRTVSEEINDQLTQGFEGFMIAFNVVFGMAFLASSFVLFLVKERAIKAKHCQFISGINTVTFWLSTFIWDFICYLIPCVILLVVFYVFDIKAYSSGVHMADILLLFLLYGWAVLPFMYLLSFFFKVPSTGFVRLTIFNILTGEVTVLAVGILNIPQLNTKAIAEGLEWLFLIVLPNYCLGQGLQDYYTNYQLINICEMEEVQDFCQLGMVNMTCCKDSCGDNCINYQDNFLAWEATGIGRELIFLFVQGLMFFTLLFLIESQYLHYLVSIIRSLFIRSPSSVTSRENSIYSMVQEDEDVSWERNRVATTPVDALKITDALVLKELSKTYGKLQAVDRLSVGIARGECFGLLGINGAGKTTTFKMLTGDEMIGFGNAYLDGISVLDNIKSAQQRLGYCPQFDALIDQMTGYETLTMYARLRGISEAQITTVVDELVRALLLEEHAHKLVKSFSGGNKRKLSTAIALVGDPPIIFLDEPTTGMDPVARRLLWDTLSRIRASGRTLVLTSHSMEECEALCTKIAIMVNGQFKCLGATQHLKNKFGEGYTLIAKVRFPDGGGETQVQPLMDFIESTFPHSILKDVHQGMVHYHITDKSISWARVFGTLEKARNRFEIEDYSVSQTTLEQVFINFARCQVEPQEVYGSTCRRCCHTCRLCCCACCANEDEDTLTILDHEEHENLASGTNA